MGAQGRQDRLVLAMHSLVPCGRLGLGEDGIIKQKSRTFNAVLEEGVAADSGDLQLEGGVKSAIVELCGAPS